MTSLTVLWKRPALCPSTYSPETRWTGDETGQLRLCLEHVPKVTVTCGASPSGGQVWVRLQAASLTPICRTQLCNTESNWHLGTPWSRDLFENYIYEASSTILSLAGELLTFPEMQRTKYRVLGFREKTVWDTAELLASYISFAFYFSKINKYC